MGLMTGLELCSPPVTSSTGWSLLQPPKGVLAMKRQCLTTWITGVAFVPLLSGLYSNSMSAEMSSPSVSQLLLGLEQAAPSQMSPGRCLGGPQPELKHTEGRSGKQCKVLKQLSFSRTQAEKVSPSFWKQPGKLVEGTGSARKELNNLEVQLWLPREIFNFDFWEKNCCTV